MEAEEEEDYHSVEDQMGKEMAVLGYFKKGQIVKRRNEFRSVVR